MSRLYIGKHRLSKKGMSSVSEVLPHLLKLPMKARHLSHVGESSPVSLLSRMLAEVAVVVEVDLAIYPWLPEAAFAGRIHLEALPILFWERRNSQDVSE